MPNPALKATLAAGKFVAAPGVFDMISTLVADRMGFHALYVTGYGTVASGLGLPDAGIATYSDMIERIGKIAAHSKTPVIADADTGYGGLLNVRHTVRGYEAAGVTAIQIEDQEFPKRCGHTGKRPVIPAEDMVMKVRVAADSRSSADFLIIARTDARGSLGLEEAIRRGNLYAQAGADIIFIEATQSEAEIAEVCRRIERPILANMVPGGFTPVLPAAKLHELGVAIGIFPTIGFLAATAAMQAVYGDLKDNGAMTGRAELFGFADFNKLIGFDEIHAFEQRFPQV